MDFATILQKVLQADSSSRFVQDLPDEYIGEATPSQMLAFLKHARSCCVGKHGAQPQKAAALSEVMPILFLPHSPGFKHLNNLVVVYQLVIRILEPRKMNQQAFGLCGPSHFALLLAKTKPVTYARIAAQLFHFGKCDVDGWTIEPGVHVRDFNPHGSMPQADWLVAASIRNSEREIPLNPADRATYENTQPWVLYPWLVNAGYRHIMGYLCSQPAHAMFDSAARVLAGMHSEFFYPDRNLGVDHLPAALRDPVENIRFAAAMSTSGWKLLMLINAGWADLTPDKARSNMSPAMRAANPAVAARGDLKVAEDRKNAVLADLNDYGFLGYKALVPKANHWIFVKRIEIAGDMLEVTRYTWGEKKKTVPFPIVEFAKGYMGFFAVRQ
ncbi:hypothetical protein [Gemmatimonas sp.]